LRLITEDPPAQACMPKAKAERVESPPAPRQTVKRSRSAWAGRRTW
jgi:hypothetical protein